MRILIIFLVSIFFCGKLFSQTGIYTPVSPTSYGNHVLRQNTDSALGIPTKSGLRKSTSDTTTQIFYNYNNGHVYGWSRLRDFFMIDSISQSLDSQTIRKLFHSNAPIIYDTITGIIRIDTGKSVSQVVTGFDLKTWEIDSILTKNSNSFKEIFFNSTYLNRSGIKLKGQRSYISIEPTKYKVDSIFFVGTSIEAGSNLSSPTTTRYSYLASKIIGCVEVNRGLAGSSLQAGTPPPFYAGQSLEGDLTRIPTYNSLANNYLVISEGVNDLGEGGQGNYDTSHFKASYRVVLNNAISKGWPIYKIILNSPFYVSSAGFAFYGAANGGYTPTYTLRDQYVKAVSDVVEEYGVGFVDMFSAIKNNDTTTLQDADGVHYNVSGNRFIAGVFSSYFSSLTNIGTTNFVGPTYYSKLTSGRIPFYDAVSGLRDYDFLTYNYTTENLGVAGNANGPRLQIYSVPNTTSGDRTGIDVIASAQQNTYSGTMIGFKSSVSGSGLSTPGYFGGVNVGFYSRCGVDFGTVAKSYGFFAQPLNTNGQTITKYAGLLLETRFGTGTIGNYYGVLQLDPFAKNAFIGKVVIGDTVHNGFSLRVKGGPVSIDSAVLASNSDSAFVWDRSTGAIKYAKINGTATGVSSVTSANADIAVANTMTAPVITLNSGVGPNQVVKRDGSGNLNAETVTTNANLTGDVTSVGNATTYNSIVPVNKGGTNITSYTTGDLVYANGSTSLNKLNAVAGNVVLVGNGAGAAPSWSSSPNLDFLGITGANPQITFYPTSGNQVSIGSPSSVTTYGFIVPPAPASIAGQYLASTGANGILNWVTPTTSTGTVTSVAMTMPGVLFDASVSGSPITTSGTLSPTLATQSAYSVLARGSGSGTPSFQSLDSNFINGTHTENYYNTKYFRLATFPNTANKYLTGYNTFGSLTDSITAISWALSGNSAAYGSYIGTSNNRSFRIRSNGIERINIDSLGNIIAGTSAVPIASASFNFANDNSGLKFQQVSIPSASYFGAIYGSNNTPSATNYALAVQPNGNATMLNGATSVSMGIAGAYQVYATSAGVALNNSGAFHQPDASAALDVTATAKGFLQPRLTNTQMNAVSSPATGLELYNTTNNSPYFYNGSSWIAKGGISAGTDISFSTTAGVTTISADTSTGATKLATQGNVTRAIASLVPVAGTPTISAGTGAGTSPTVVNYGSNYGGVCNITTGATPSSSSVVATITLVGGLSYPNGTSVILYPYNSAAATLSGVSMVYTVGGGSSFTINSGSVALASATQYIWNYVIVGW